MPGIVIVGTQWGDEAKGKITDFLAKDAECIVRFNGGANAGHTVVAEGKTYKFHIIPSGVLYKKNVYIGNGVVIDPRILLEELEELRKHGFKPNLRISDRAHIVFDFHKLLDGAQENFKGIMRAGTTKRGIGPSYSDKAARFGVRVADLFDQDTLHRKLNLLVNQKGKILRMVYDQEVEINLSTILAEVQSFGDFISDYVCDVSAEINTALDNGKMVLFEGAQGTLLDIDHGVYPYGSSSNTIAGGACTGVGVGPTRINEVIGVMKAYTSRVGTGPVPTELKGSLGKRIREVGKEYGTTTGRPRRVGWLDLVPVKYSIRLSNIHKLAITKLDVLNGIDPIRICTHYKCGKDILSTLPASISKFEMCEPVYEDLPGWSRDLNWRKIVSKGYDAIPYEGKTYIERVEKIVSVPITILSIGPERESTMVLNR